MRGPKPRSPPSPATRPQTGHRLRDGLMGLNIRVGSIPKVLIFEELPCPLVQPGAVGAVKP